MRALAVAAVLVLGAGLVGGIAASGCSAESSAGPGTVSPFGGFGGTGAGGIGAGGATGGSGGEPCVPEAVELCDGVDNTCDGVVDEDCDCIEGETQPCYSGDPLLVGVGECAEGIQTCDVFGVFGTECIGETLPSADVCDGLDNDCDHGIDEDLGTVTCGLGICQMTVDACAGGQPVPCVPGTPNPVEICDGALDDNCDGQIDGANEGCSCTNDEIGPCYSGSLATRNVGECADGTHTCLSGQWEAACHDDVLPATEICDGLDNDCDGTADDGDPDGGVSCTTGNLGVCAAGIRHCHPGGQLLCDQTVQPSAETCDGQDNDCNGQVDEGNPGGGGNCNTGNLGICAVGTWTCVGGAIICVQNQQPGAETCNGQDDNCNGQVDEGNPGSGGACNTGLLGVCAAGIRQCQSGSLVCVQSAQPSSEACDSLDNDCDGAVDDGNPGGGLSCSTGLPGACAPGTTQCQSGAVSCVQNVQPAPEVCDAIDNNCNGQNNEGNPGGGVACGTGLPGVCAPGTTQCQSGTLNCVQNVSSSSEVCDGQDNNCNGSTDEGNPGGNLSCNTGLLGVCQPGHTVCSGGAISCVQNTASSAETCDGLDNNCNGQADEGDPGSGASCNSGIPGVCQPGHVHCVSGALSCVADYSPTGELCDGLDNDCNGTVDNGAASACAGQNPSAVYVSTWGCSGGGCQISACNSAHANLDGSVSNGCECNTDAYANVCGSAGSASVPKGATTLMTGVIDVAGQSDYLQFNFTVPAMPAAYHPKVALTDSGGGRYRMDVLGTTCVGLSCNDGGGGTNLTTWEQNYTYNASCAGQGNCSDGTTRQASVRVRVYLAPGYTPSCVTYTVTATNP